MTADRLRAASLWLAVVAANALFMWMFLSVARIEVLGEVPQGVSDDPHALAAMQFVANWRHGMAGNSPIYLPGFFALAAALWYWTRAQPPWRLVVHGLLALAAGSVIAWLAAPIGEAAAATAFATTWTLSENLGGSAWHAGLIGACTAACWTVLVVASKKALVLRTFRPFCFVPIPYVALFFSRRWSLGGLVELWGARLADGDLVAVASLVAIPFLATIFVVTARRTT